jgi:hypothetical protein
MSGNSQAKLDGMLSGLVVMALVCQGITDWMNSQKSPDKDRRTTIPRTITVS